MASKCLGCKKTVFKTEAVIALDGSWHGWCLKCQVCKARLSVSNVYSYEKLPYCKAHLPVIKHTVTSDDVLAQHNKEAQKFASAVTAEPSAAQKGTGSWIKDPVSTKPIVPTVQTLPVLKTERLTLRAYTLADFDAVHDYTGHADTWSYIAVGPNTSQDTKAFLEKAVANSLKVPITQYYYAVTQTESNQLVGGCSLLLEEDPVLPKTAHLGFMVNKKYWRSGFALESAKALLDLAFAQLNLHRLVGSCSSENIGSVRVMEKIGMRKEGVEVESKFFRGKWHDWVSFAILGRDFKPEPKPEPESKPEVEQKVEQKVEQTGEHKVEQKDSTNEQKLGTEQTSSVGEQQASQNGHHPEKENTVQES